MNGFINKNNVNRDFFLASKGINCNHPWRDSLHNFIQINFYCDPYNLLHHTKITFLKYVIEYE